MTRATTTAIGILILFIFSTCLYSQSWNIQTTGVYDYLWSASFPKPDTGYAVGSNGTIIKTVNGGVNWQSQSNPSGVLLHHVYFISGSLGWAVGHSGRIIKTTNGGQNWVLQSSGTSSNLFYVYFIHRNYGWVVGDNGVLKTTDGGDTWATSLVEPWVYSVYFVNQNTGWAGVRYGKLFKTTNGGDNWIAQTSGTVSTSFSMYFINENTGWAAGDYNSVIKTTNGGSTWFHQDYEFGSFSTTFRSVVFANDQMGWMAGLDGLVLRTTNGGTNWVQQSVPVNGDYLSIRVNGVQGWAVGENGTVIHSDNVTNLNTISSSVPERYNLSQNYPNPFNPSTKISFDIPKSGFTSLKIYDILGKNIATLLSSELQEGTYEYEFDASALNSGIYYYVLNSGSFTETRKMMLVK
ncbi:MAG: T9SS type A sorting domain-containing protein [Ignavibacteriae bacterium]|nr:T9SS type A sorting domain-containing protein [Ignavibacteriota bacterium]MCB9244433.1 T9SS type A sorting domain-containing protein [Ignavibacteriales bacterium]